MLVAEQECKRVHKTLQENAQALKDIENRLSNKGDRAKYRVPKILYQHGSKIKEKSCHHLKKGKM